MMQCSQCMKVFAQEKSFCPFDGSPLKDAGDRIDFIGYIIDNKYQLDEKIGEGSTGAVYKATHLQLLAPVAVKLMRRDLVDNHTAVERFRREAYAAMMIRHPNAIGVMDFGITSDDLVYVVMEFLAGRSLGSLLREKGRLSFQDVDKIIQPVCAVLNVAHSRGVVHRDLKPDNIFLHIENGREIIKVLDFGMAKLIHGMEGMPGASLTGVGTVIGTPNYISPEQCTGGAKIDPRADIYSLGIIVYRMLTGKLPFEGPSSIAVIYKQVTELPKPLYEVYPEIPALLNAVVMKAIEKDPDKRPSDVLTFADQLSAAIKAVTEQEFQKAFLDATEKDIDAALLLALGGNAPSRSYNSAGETAAEPSVGSAAVKAKTDEFASFTELTEKQDLARSITRELVSIAPKYLRGRFPECDLATVLHTLIGLRATGSLLVYTAALTSLDIFKESAELPPPFCSIYLEEGDVERARLGTRQGEEAFFQLFQMPVEGAYIFKPGRLSDNLGETAQIKTDGEDLWLKAMDLKEEIDEYSDIFPDLLAQIEICGDELNWSDIDTLEIAYDICELIQQGDSDLAILLAKSPCCNAKTYRILTRLLSTGQIRIVE